MANISKLNQGLLIGLLLMLAINGGNYHQFLEAFWANWYLKVGDVIFPLLIMASYLLFMG